MNMSEIFTKHTRGRGLILKAKTTRGDTYIYLACDLYLREVRRRFRVSLELWTLEKPFRI